LCRYNRRRKTRKKLEPKEYRRIFAPTKENNLVLTTLKKRKETSYGKDSSSNED
jgi:hypothetical protein